MRKRHLSFGTLWKKSGKRFAPGMVICLLILCLSLTAGCSGETAQSGQPPASVSVSEAEPEPAEQEDNAAEPANTTADSAAPGQAESPEANVSGEAAGAEMPEESEQPAEPGQPAEPEQPAETFSLEDVPAYSGGPFAAVNGNEPYFTADDLTTDSFETYSELDDLGRCRTAYACVGEDLMPTKERGSIGQVKPSGWHTVKYDFVDGKYLYNRCHLIGYQLTAENANKRNLITGTRYMNVDGMLPFENMVADYVHETGNHVLYRVTPVYEGDNLLASGVLMEAESVEDEGEGVLYNVFVYNVQPNVTIDYATGESKSQVKESASEEKASASYILNASTKKFHVPECSSVKQMNESNKIAFTGSREEAIEQGYDPCGRCHP